MSTEKRILSGIILNREVWAALNTYAVEQFSNQGRVLYDCVSQFYNADTHALRINIEQLHVIIQDSVPNHVQNFIDIVSRLDMELSIPNIVEEVASFVKEQTARALSNSLLTSDEDTIDGALQTYLSVRQDNGTDYLLSSQLSLTELLHAGSEENCINLWPIHHAIGGVPLGTHVYLFARTNIGKTLAAIHMTYGCLKQDRKVLYLANEEAPRAQIPRILSRVGLVPIRDVREMDEDHLASRLAANNYHLFEHAYLPSMTLKDINSLCGKVKPDVLILDQIINVSSGRKEGLEGMHHVTREMRNIINNHNVVGVSIGQAGAKMDSMGNVIQEQYLKMEDIYGSNTVVQAACDVIVGIGMSDEQDAMDQRTMSILKDKCGVGKVNIDVQLDKRFGSMRVI